MWDLQPQFLSQLRQNFKFPPISYDWFLIIILSLMLLKILVTKIQHRYFSSRQPKWDQQLSSLQYSPIYHLLIVILVLSDIDWNIFDLGVWMCSYIGLGIIRKALLGIKLQRDALLNGYSYDVKVVKLLSHSKILGGLLFILSFYLFIITELTFAGLSMKVVNLLVFPILMLTIDSLFLFLCSAAVDNDILCFYNQNINEILPTYKLELAQKIVGNSVKVWHYYNIFRLFLRALLQKMGLLDYMWIFSVISAFFNSMKGLVSTFSKYRNYNKLIKRFDRLFRRTTSAPDQNCTICLTQLLNCRQLSSCGHLFHYKCLFQWMQTQMECPICRAPIALA